MAVRGDADTAGTAKDWPVGVLGPWPAESAAGAGPPELLPWLASAGGPPDVGDHHAVLLSGPSGVGQFELAVAIAQGLLCEGQVGSKPGWPCGTCAACRLVQAQTHPDLLVLLPEALREPLRWVQAAGGVDSGAAGEGSSKRKPSRELRVDDIREAVTFAQTTSARGRGKIVVLSPAERMNAIAANALLKTLEEPPAGVRFVIATGDADRLLPTVRSRCRSLPVLTPDKASAVAWLNSQGLAGATAAGGPSHAGGKQDAEALLAAAGGQPLDALALAADGVAASAWRELPQQAAAGDATALQGWSVPRLLHALACLCSDLQRMAVGDSPRRFPEAALLPVQAKVSGQDAATVASTLAALNDWAGRLQQWSRHADHPYHAPLVIDALVADACRAIAPRRQSAARIPGARS